MSESLAQVYARSHPGRVAASLVGFEPHDIIEFLASLQPSVEASVLARLSSGRAVSVLATLPDQKVAELLIEASHDDSLTLISYLQSSRYAAIVTAANDSKGIKEKLYGYSAKSLGAIASPDFIAIEKGRLVTDALRELDAVEGTVELSVFVVEASKLLGRLPILPLVTKANADFPVERLMIDSEYLSADTTADVATHSELWRNHHVLPVVDKQQRLIGVVSRRQLEAVSQEAPIEAAIGLEQIVGEMASGYLMVCSQLLDAVIGGRK